MTSSQSRVTYGYGRRGVTMTTMTQQLLRALYLLLLWDHLVLLSQAGSVRRLCKNEIDVMSDEGVHIEAVEQSHVELALSNKRVRKRNVIRFEFRTKGENGILFYGRQRRDPSELLALRLMGGDVYYTIHCSTVSADVLIPYRTKLNDGRWHHVVVRFRRGGKKTQIEVDGVKDSKTYEVSCGLPTSLVFGGVSRQDRRVVNRILGTVPHYRGCIRRVDLPTALRSPPKYYAISVCENR
ncbi:laminin subunit alpha-2-like [Babylonia areolata]|uniref:laminin subunit alpha-2-like n=1 Tax=Babylonia areolata TaxID=304850 RepID=UPI003FCF008E